MGYGKYLMLFKKILLMEIFITEQNQVKKDKLELLKISNKI